MLLATAACNFSTSELQKAVRECGVLCILTCKCASRHIGVPFFDIGTSKTGTVWFFRIFTWTTALQKVLRHRHFFNIFTRKCISRNSGVQFFDIGPSKSAPTPSFFSTFSLENAFLATAACNFSTSDLQKVLRHRQFLSGFT